MDKDTSISEGRSVYDNGSPNILNGKKVVIAGYGNIGREIRKYLTPFNCEVIGIASKKRQAEIEICGIQELLSKTTEADIVIGLLPEKENLKKIFNKEFLILLKGVYLLITDARHMLTRMRYLKPWNGTIKGAALDNYETSGVLTSNTAELNILLSPHIQYTIQITGKPNLNYFPLIFIFLRRETWMEYKV